MVTNVNQEPEAPPPPPPGQRAPAATPGTTPPHPKGPGPKNPWLAAVLSTFPGMGNVYNGLYTRAVTFFVIIIGCMYLADHGSELFGFAVAFFWIFNIIDAYRQATLINYGYAEDPDLDRIRSEASARDKLFAGAALVVVGALGLVDRYFTLDWLADFWPVILIAVGGWLIFAAIKAKRDAGAITAGDEEY